MSELDMLSQAQRRRDKLQKQIRERRNSIGDDDPQTRAWQRQLQREHEHIRRLELLLSTEQVKETVVRSSGRPARLRKGQGGAVARLSARPSNSRAKRSGSARQQATGGRHNAKSPEGRKLMREMLKLREQWDERGRPASGRLYHQLKSLAEKVRS